MIFYIHNLQVTCNKSPMGSRSSAMSDSCKPESSECRGLQSFRKNLGVCFRGKFREVVMEVRMKYLVAVQQLQESHVVTKKGFLILQHDSAIKNLFGGKAWVHSNWPKPWKIKGEKDRWCRQEFLWIYKWMKLQIFNIEMNQFQSQIYYDPASVCIMPKNVEINISEIRL